MNNALNEDKGAAQRARAQAAVSHDELLDGRPEVPEDLHIGHLIASTAEYNAVKPLTKRVWVPGFRDPKTGKLGMVGEVRKPSPDNEIRIYAKSRESHIPEEAAKWMLPDHIPASGRGYRWECIWKLVYCCVRPVVTFDWAVKIMSLSHGSDVVKPLIDTIDELMATPAPIDNLTGGNIFAYPTLLGGAKIAARDGKLAEYFGSLEKSVAQAILDNARTMTMIQLMVIREDAELQAVVNHIVTHEIKAQEYEPSPTVAEGLRDPWGEYMTRLQRRAQGIGLAVADADAAKVYRAPDDSLPPLPEESPEAPTDDGPLADVRAFTRESMGYDLKRQRDPHLTNGDPNRDVIYWTLKVGPKTDAYYVALAASYGLEEAFLRPDAPPNTGVIFLRAVTPEDDAFLKADEPPASGRATAQ